jgi:hypothetical protein
VHAQSSVTCIVIIELMIVFTINLILVKIDRCLRHAWARQNTYYSRHIKYYVVLCVYSFEMLQKPKRNSGVRVQPFNLQGGLWFFVSFRNVFSDNTIVRIFIFFVAHSANFFSTISCSLIKSVFVIWFISYLGNDHLTLWFFF